MAFPSTYNSGSQSATVTTEHTLQTINIVGTFQFSVDLAAMVDGDVTEMRVYRIVKAGGTTRVVEEYTFYGALPTDNQLWESDIYANSLTDTDALKCTLKQTFGTSRAFPWLTREIA